MTFSERSNFTLFRPTTARKPGPAVTMATAEPLDHAESLGRAWKSEWLARDTPGGGEWLWGWGELKGVCVCVRGVGGGERWEVRGNGLGRFSAQVDHDGMRLGCRARRMRAGGCLGTTQTASDHDARGLRAVIF